MTTDTPTTARGRGRPRNLLPTVEWKLMIPEYLAAHVELLCHDPVRNKPVHGARSAYIIRLIRDDFKRRGIISPDEDA